eukprot:351266_1
MAHQEVNEMGLLSYNYDLEDPTGQIDNNTNEKDPHKEPMISPKLGQTQPAVSSPSSAPPTKVTQCNRFCVQVFYWVPIRTLGLFGSLALFVFPFLDAKFNKPSPVAWLLGWYICAFALVGLFIESPTWWLTRTAQTQIFKWARFLRRTSGRAGFYIVVSSLTFANTDDGTTISMFAGIYMIAVSLIMLLFSVLAAKQLHLMFDHMGANGDLNVPLQQRILSHYEQLDGERTKKIGAPQLYKFAQDVLNRKLSNSERYTIQLYLDVSCNGYITPEDWTKQFMRSNT